MNTGRVRLTDDSLVGLRIMRGDVAHITLDCDVKAGDLAPVFTDTGEMRLAFYHDHDGAICLRRSRDLCEGQHHNGGLLFGHVVRVARGGRTVRVGCRLRQAAHARGARKRMRRLTTLLAREARSSH